MSRRFGWHSGTLYCRDIKAQGDLYVQDDIVFSDVSAGVLGVTGGIDMSGTTSAIGIDMGGTYSTSAINIDGTCGAAINENVSSSSTNPGKLNYWRFTLTGDMSGGGATCLEIRSTFNGSANTTNSVTGAEIKARHTTDNSYTVGQLRGVVGNADAKNATVTTAYGIEASIDVSSGGTVTTAALIHANLNNSGTITNSYGAYIEGTSSVSIGTGIYMRYIDKGIEIGACTTGIHLSGAVTTGINIAGDATDAIKISGGTVTDAMEIGACTNAINVSGNVTNAMLIGGTQTAALRIEGAGTYLLSFDAVEGCISDTPGTLTPTHKIAINIDGVGTRYIHVGTVA